MIIFVFWFLGIFPSKRGVRGVTPSYEVRGVTTTDAIIKLQMLIYFTPVTNFPVFYGPKLQDYRLSDSGMATGMNKSM